MCNPTCKTVKNLQSLKDPRYGQLSWSRLSLQVLTGRQTVPPIHLPSKYSPLGARLSNQARTQKVVCDTSSIQDRLKCKSVLWLWEYGMDNFPRITALLDCAKHFVDCKKNIAKSLRNAYYLAIFCFPWLFLGHTLQMSVTSWLDRFWFEIEPSSPLTEPRYCISDIFYVSVYCHLKAVCDYSRNIKIK